MYAIELDEITKATFSVLLSVRVSLCVFILVQNYSGFIE